MVLVGHNVSPNVEVLIKITEHSDKKAHSVLVGIFGRTYCKPSCSCIQSVKGSLERVLEVSTSPRQRR